MGSVIISSLNSQSGGTGFDLRQLRTSEACYPFGFGKLVPDSCGLIAATLIKIWSVVKSHV